MLQVSFISSATENKSYGVDKFHVFSDKSKYYAIEEKIISEDIKGIYKIEPGDSPENVIYKVLAASKYLISLTLSLQSTPKIEDQVNKTAEKGCSMYPEIPELKMLYASTLSDPVKGVLILSTMVNFSDICPGIPVLLLSAFNAMYGNSKIYKQDKRLKSLIIFAMMGDNPETCIKKSRIMAIYWAKKINMTYVPDPYKNGIKQLASEQININDTEHIWHSILQYNHKK
jgi:hypothetical protein